MLANRRAARLRQAVLEPRQYAAAVRALSVYRRPDRMLWSYATGRGTYPRRCAVRTPLGVVEPLLYTHHDLLTVNEVFCRLDYGAPADGSVVVDLGANIGLSALYFLTRGPSVRCHAVEPSPVNVQRLHETLAGMEDRYTVLEAAVERRDATATFCVEPSGRYGMLGLNRYPERITVRTVEVNGMLERILEQEGRIDLLKVDIEISVVPVIAAIRPDVLANVREIVLEAEGFALDLPGFRRRSAGIIHRFTRAS